MSRCKTSIAEKTKTARGGAQIECKRFTGCHLKAVRTNLGPFEKGPHAVLRRFPSFKVGAHPVQSNFRPSGHRRTRCCGILDRSESLRTRCRDVFHRPKPRRTRCGAFQTVPNAIAPGAE